MAVLLENVLERLDTVENRLNITSNVTSFVARPGVPKESHSLLAQGVYTIDII